MSICAMSPFWPRVVCGMAPLHKIFETGPQQEVETKCWENFATIDIQTCDQRTPLIE